MSKSCGPGYASPRAAYTSGNREKLLYITCVVPGGKRPDYLVTVDIDPTSKTYCQVLHRMPVLHCNDELHHSGWNACSSCYGDNSRSRSKMVLPALGSDRIYIIDTKSDPIRPKIDKVIEPSDLYKWGCSTPHTTHCLADGDIMVSTLGDGPEGNAKGDFLLIDGKSFTIKDTYVKGNQKPAFGYDYWYQPYHNVMISSEWGAPKSFKTGLDIAHVEQGNYGTHLNVFDWKEGKMIQKVDLGMEGVMPLEIRFLHDPLATEGYVGCALYANIFRFFKTDEGTWAAEKVIDVPSKKVEGWILPDMPGVITDILISMDDRYLYFSNWVHGDIRQYDITDTAKPKLVGQLFLGGSILKDGPVKVVEDSELKSQPSAAFAKGRRLRGSPQMLQLSLDGKRLYVTTSLFSVWDKQFYSDMFENGSQLIQIDVDTDEGGLTLNDKFLVDFAEEPDGPALAHEMRYPGGDCTSDIYLAKL